MTPDWAAKATAVPYAEFVDPQSLNLYSYVRNIPLGKADLDGHETIDPQRIMNAIQTVSNGIHVARELTKIVVPVTFKQGKQFTDSESGNNISVRGNKVVVTDQKGNIVSQFKNTKANTQQRVESDRWVPKPKPEESK